MPITQPLKKYELDLLSINARLDELFGKERCERFYEGLYQYSCFALFVKGCSHIPGGLARWSDSIKKGSRPNPPEGYKLWLHVFEDFSGMHYYLFYPKKVKKGEFIKVLFHGCSFRGFIEWEHGEVGLFWTIVFEWLLMEAFYHSSDEAIIKYIKKNILPV